VDRACPQARQARNFADPNALAEFLPGALDLLRLGPRGGAEAAAYNTGLRRELLTALDLGLDRGQAGIYPLSDHVVLKLGKGARNLK
jgi:hypothetical protein